MSDTDKLDHYLAAWELSNPRLLARTMTSQIYTVARGAETVILKLLSPLETEEQRGVLSLRYFDGHGAVRLLRYDEGAQLMEYAAGEPLVTLVERGEDERATRVIARVIARLHGVPQDVPYDGLIPLDRWFGALFAKAAADRQSDVDSIYRHGAAELGLDRWRVLAFTYAYACNNASQWLPLGGGEMVQWSLTVAEIVEPHLGPLSA